LRITSAVALDRPVAQTAAKRDATVREGQILLSYGLLRPKWTLVSAATTPDQIGSVQPLQEALRLFGTAGYARNGTVDGVALDTALNDATNAIGRLRSQHRWPNRLLTRRAD
jgi:hypothetical protein